MQWSPSDKQPYPIQNQYVFSFNRHRIKCLSLPRAVFFSDSHAERCQVEVTRFLRSVY